MDRAQDRVHGRFVDWIDMSQDRDQWVICGLDLFGSG
jgi:hypothetical protein